MSIGNVGGPGQRQDVQAFRGPQQGQGIQRPQPFPQQGQNFGQQQLPSWGADSGAGANLGQTFSPTQSALGGLREQRSEQDPLAGLTKEQRAEIKQDFQNAQSDGQVTDQERQALGQKIQSFKQQQQGGFPPAPPQGGGGFQPQGGGLGGVLGSFQGGGF